MKNLVYAGVMSAVAFGVLTVPAMAQRDPAYAAARSSGQVGEKMDGYLAIVGSATPELQRLVSDINIKRRAVYAGASARKWCDFGRIRAVDWLPADSQDGSRRDVSGT